MNHLSSLKKIIIALLVISTLSGITTKPAQVQAQIPTINIPIITSPYILDEVGIKKNTTNTWDIPYIVPPNTQSTNFALQINGTTLTGIPQAQLLNGRLVFKVPDASFTVGGTALIGLIQKTPFKVVSLDAVAVLAQGLQPSPFAFNQQALVQNSDGSWNIGYYIPPNTAVGEYALTIGSNPPLTNGLAGYGGMIFKAPESWFNPGASLTLTLTHTPTGKVVATDVAFVPVSGPSPYVLDQASIKQNPTGTWSVRYTVPTNTVAGNFSLQINGGPLITNGSIASGKLVFTPPKDSLVPGTQASLVLKNETTGQVRATNTITVPSGIGGLFVLEFPPSQNTDGNWKVSYKIPPNTIAGNYELLVGANEVSVTGGIITNNKLVFTVPESLFSINMTSSVFILKDKTTGRAYRADGTEFAHSAPPGTTSYPTGALKATFPSSEQTIGQNEIGVTIKLTVQKDIPSVSTTYIWKKKEVSSPNDTPKELVKTTPTPAGVKAGTTRDIPVTFPNLQAGQTYTLSVQDTFSKETIGTIELTTLGQSESGNDSGTPSGGDNQTDPEGQSGQNAITAKPSQSVSTDSCTNKDCYETFSGLNEALGGQFSSFTEAQDLTGFINALIGFAIGIAGVLAVIMIMYQGFLYMSTDNVTTKSTARSRIVSTVAGFVLLLSIYTLLRTINPDLLVLMPSIEGVALQTGATLDSETFQKITGEPLGKPGSYDQLIKDTATTAP